MKRRGFLKLMGAAPVAAPAMAKEAATQMYQQAGLASFAGNAVGSNGLGMPMAQTASGFQNGDRWWWEKQRLAKLLKRSVEKRDFDRLNTPVHALDPDLVANRSFSLSTKVRIQRDRNFERSEAQEISRLEKVIAGWFDD